MIQPVAKKSLGQHWLSDEATLRTICNEANLKPSDVVLEIGPGLGTLTSHLVARTKKVIAVEFDQRLAQELPDRVPDDKLEVHHADILHFNVTALPPDYKVVANVPYYITSKIVRLLLESANPPVTATLLVQKEVAQRMAAQPGQMSVLAVATQFYAEPKVGPVVPAHLFTPPPEVDSQIITLQRRRPLLPAPAARSFFRVVRAGFGEKRKKLRSSLSGGLHITKDQADTALQRAGIAPDVRAQELSLDDWQRLTKELL